MIEALIVFILIVANGVFALSEMSLVSAKKLRLEQLSAAGNKGATKALELMSRPNRFLSTVQIGITLIGVLAGAFGGSALSKPLAELLSKVAWLAPYAQTISFILVVVLITYFSLVIGELVPKRIALSNPERFAVATAGMMTVIATVTRPLVKFLSASMNLVLRLLGVNPDQVESMTYEEVILLLEQATEAGLVEEAEQDIVENVFLLGDKRVTSVMTSRPEIVWLDTEKTTEEIEQDIRNNPHNRYVVADGDLDHVRGVVLVRDLLLSGFPKMLDWETVKTPLYIPETMTILSLLEEFRLNQQHLALIIDEYGKVEGLVTVTDLLEAMVGDLPDINEGSNPLAVQRDDESWLIDGLLTMDDLQIFLELDSLPPGSGKDFQTVGGFVLAELEHIPQASETFSWANLKFEIVDMDGNRVDKVLVSKIPEASQEAS
ncbi:MAG: HlyC/CorC family transporter [Trueperaceae bacterium]|nr:HlyC/CorC family transporter [Trueperaceae bacterium]